MAKPIQLQDAYKTYTYDQDKIVSPEETIQRVRERLAHLDMEILKETVRIDTGRLDIPIYISRCGVDAVKIVGTQKQMGKGGTPFQSEASALMELVERFSFFSFIEEQPFIWASQKELGDQTIPFDWLSRCFYDTSPVIPKVKEIFETAPLAWAWATHIREGKAVLLPIHWFYLIHEYNGPAAGNSMEEAILQSLCEVVERHVSSIISHEKIITPNILPDSVKDPIARELMHKFERLGIPLYIKDFSLDTGIPTVGTLAYDPSTFPEKSEIVFTAGTTPSPEKSLIRAITEIAQLAGDFINRTTYRPTLPKFKDLKEASYITEGGNRVSIESLPNLTSVNFKEEVYSAVEALTKRELEVLVVDVTHPQIGIPAVYTLIPGAHFRDRTRHTDTCFHLAKLLSQYPDPQRAAYELRRMEKAFPERYEVQFFLGYAKERSGHPEEALDHLQKALAMGPKTIDISSILCHIGVAYKDMEEYGKAIEFLEQAREYNRDQKEIYNQLGYCYYKIKEHAKAIEQFERAIEIDPGSAIDYANIGSNLREMGHVKEAMQLYRMALELDPSIEFARANLEKLTQNTL